MPVSVHLLFTHQQNNTLQCLSTEIEMVQRIDIKISITIMISSSLLLLYTRLYKLTVDTLIGQEQTANKQ